MYSRDRQVSFGLPSLLKGLEFHRLSSSGSRSTVLCTFCLNEQTDYARFSGCQELGFTLAYDILLLKSQKKKNWPGTNYVKALSQVMETDISAKPPGPGCMLSR